jgi:hypothetical protein
MFPFFTIARTTFGTFLAIIAYFSIVMPVALTTAGAGNLFFWNTVLFINIVL